MAKQIIEARVQQKVDTLEGWNLNDLTLLDGEQAFIRDSSGLVIGYKLGNGKKKFRELPDTQYYKEANRVENITNLRGLSGIQGQVVTLLGYYTAGDKEPINYKWTTTQGVDNGASIINASGGSWLMAENQKVTILDFGIVNDNTIDQSIKLDALAKYCDDNNVYEIDFMNYHIQTSRTIHYTTNRGSRLTGIAFSKPKKIKNLKIQHDKSLNLYQGASLILWLPDYLPDFEETFEIENIVFDPYNENFTLISQEGDGMLGGLYVYRAGDIINIPSSTQTKYCFKAKDINFISPAISRNISTANVRFKKSEVTNCKGEYWALYTHIFADYSYYENLKGLYRKDLQDNSDRFLVWTMIHHEPETRNYTIDLDLISVVNCTAINNEGGIETVYKHHTVDKSTYNVKKITINNIVGNLGWSEGIICNAENVEILNIIRQESNFYFTGLQIKNLVIKDSVVPYMLYTFSQKTKTFEKVVIKDSTITRNFNNIQGVGIVTINYLELNNVDFDSSSLLSTNGLLRNGNTTILYLNVINSRNYNQRLIDAIIHKIDINGYTLENDTYEGHIVMRGDNISKKLSINNLVSNAEPLNASTMLITNSGTGSTIDFKNYTNSVTKKRIGINAENEVNVFPSKSVTTANLPVLDANKIGVRIYDSTLKAYKVWNGTSWLLDTLVQSVAVADVSTTPPIQLVAQTVTTIEQAQTAINNIVSMVNSMQTNQVELKTKLNAKLVADRNSGQQA